MACSAWSTLLRSRTILAFSWNNWLYSASLSWYSFLRCLYIDLSSSAELYDKQSVTNSAKRFAYLSFPSRSMTGREHNEFTRFSTTSTALLFLLEKRTLFLFQAALVNRFATTCDFPVPGGPVTIVSFCVNAWRIAASCSVFMGKTSSNGKLAFAPEEAASATASCIQSNRAVSRYDASVKFAKTESSFSSPTVYDDWAIVRQMAWL